MSHDCKYFRTSDRSSERILSPGQFLTMEIASEANEAPAELEDTVQMFKTMMKKAGGLIEQLLLDVVNQGSKLSFVSCLERAPEAVEMLQELVKMRNECVPVTFKACADAAAILPEIVEMFYQFSSWLFMGE